MMSEKLILNEKYFNSKKDEIAVHAMCDNIPMEEFHKYIKVYTMCIDYLKKSKKKSLHVEDIEHIIDYIGNRNKFRRDYFISLLNYLETNF